MAIPLTSPVLNLVALRRSRLQRRADARERRAAERRLRQAVRAFSSGRD